MNNSFTNEESVSLKNFLDFRKSDKSLESVDLCRRKFIHKNIGVAVKEGRGEISKIL